MGTSNAARVLQKYATGYPRMKTEANSIGNPAVVLRNCFRYDFGCLRRPVVAERSWS